MKIADLVRFKCDHSICGIIITTFQALAYVDVMCFDGVVRFACHRELELISESR
jgi:hypothetical protein